ncbi:MAG: type II toxin-antitoxin system HicA family toxin [Firmicutes bacterium]|nr:type II toxin-antitoxin system HicA family toxin [Bacillota bacterium]
MTRKEKRIHKLLNRECEITFSEVQVLLEDFGYELQNKGKTSGSRVIFRRSVDGAKILLHRPHPEDILKPYARRQLIEVLKQRGDIQ